jgi:hypothetical protein
MTDPATTATPGRQYDAVLHLLDRQIVDPDDQLVAKVDDLELTRRDDGRWAVSAILTGPGALGPRLHGRLGEWVGAVWRRLHHDAEPTPGRIPVSDVVDIDSAVTVGRRRDTLQVDGFEVWVRDHVIGRLPGSRHAE